MAKISTKTYVEAFKVWRNKFFKNGSWSSPPGGLGAEYVKHINKACDGADGNYGSGERAYDLIKSKHNITRAKIKKDLENRIRLSFGVTDKIEMKGKRAVDDLSHLEPEDSSRFLDKLDEVKAKLDTKIPRLPSYDGSTSSTRAVSGQELLDLL